MRCQDKVILDEQCDDTSAYKEKEKRPFILPCMKCRSFLFLLCPVIVQQTDFSRKCLSYEKHPHTTHPLIDIIRSKLLIHCWAHLHSHPQKWWVTSLRESVGEVLVHLHNKSCSYDPRISPDGLFSLREWVCESVCVTDDDRMLMGRVKASCAKRKNVVQLL